MTLWVFGDSFAEDSASLKDYGRLNNASDFSWHKQIAEKLNLDYKNFGKGGSSLDYTFVKFNENRNNIKQYDIIIIALTNLDRRYFFKDRPHMSTALWIEDSRELKAVQYYYEYLDNKEVFAVHLLNFLYNLQDLTKELNLHTILIPCFEDIDLFLKGKTFLHFHIADGFLNKINEDEYDTEFFEKKLKRGYVDPRANHIVRSNHNILANKILNNIEYKTNIKLTDFVTNIINEECLRDTKLIDYEFFFPEVIKKLIL